MTWRRREIIQGNHDGTSWWRVEDRLYNVPEGSAPECLWCHCGQIQYRDTLVFRDGINGGTRSRIRRSDDAMEIMCSHALVGGSITRK